MNKWIDGCMNSLYRWQMGEWRDALLDEWQLVGDVWVVKDGMNILKMKTD